MTNIPTLSTLAPDAREYGEPTPPLLRFAFRVRLVFKERIRFQPTTPNGGRVYVPAAGGDITGPMLQGKVVPYSGADWARRHLDGAAELNAHYMFEASDGTPIYVHNRGFLYGRDGHGYPMVSDGSRENQYEAQPDGTTRWNIADDTYFICIPAFDAPTGPHDWLTRNVIIGRGRRIPAPDHTVFDYYIADPWKNFDSHVERGSGATRGIR